MLFSSFFKTNRNLLLLGRWNIANQYSIVNKKIDLSNIDNCYGVNTLTFKNRKEEKEKEEDFFLSIYCFSDYTDGRKKINKH